MGSREDMKKIPEYCKMIWFFTNDDLRHIVNLHVAVFI